MDNKVDWYHSLYFRLAAAFGVGVGLVGVIQLYLVTQVSLDTLAETTQRIHWDLAAELAARLQPAVFDAADPIVIEEKLYEIGSILPQLDLFLVNSKGKIIHYYPNTHKLRTSYLSTDFLDSMLQVQTPDLPIYGHHPKSNRNDALFSVAEIYIAGERGYLYVILLSREYQTMLNQFGQFFIADTVFLGLLIISVIALLLGWLVLRYLSRHFKNLTKAVNEFEKGNLSERVQIASKDEIGNLARAVNAMADSIVESQQALLQRDRLRRQLVADITHDLRSPLTAIRGQSQVLLSEVSNDRPRERVEVIQRSAHLQQRLLDDLFELSGLEARERPPEFDSISIQKLAEDAFRAVELRAEQQQIQLQFRVLGEEPLPFAIADPTLLTRVLTNLLENALRYTPPGGSIEITAEEQDGRLQIGIHDSGRGIEKTELPKILEKHHTSGDTPYNRGLGLAIVRRIVELHGSDLEIRSKPEQGTSFLFSVEADPE